MEWGGALVLVALVVGALFALGVPAAVASGVECNVNKILGGAGSCTRQPGDAPPGAQDPTGANSIAPWNSSNPVTRATWGTYVSLGDSYSAGEGLGDYQPGSRIQTKSCGVLRIPWTHVCDHDRTVVTKHCDRSSSAYNETVSGTYDFKGGKQTWACSGSITKDIYDPNHPNCSKGAASGTHGEGCQVDRVNKQTSLVTLSIGGNDAGFADDIQSCYEHHGLQLLLQGATGGNQIVHGTSCSGEAALINEKIKNDVEPGVTADLQQIRHNAPHARIIIITYPRLFPENPTGNVDCASHVVHVCLTPADQRFLNEEAAALDNAICSAAAAAGVGAECVNAYNAFAGCESGQPDSCVQPLSVSTSAESWNPLKDVHANDGAFHPSARGQQILGQLINQEISNPPPGVGGR